MRIEWISQIARKTSTLSYCRHAGDPLHIPVHTGKSRSEASIKLTKSHLNKKAGINCQVYNYMHKIACILYTKEGSSHESNPMILYLRSLTCRGWPINKSVCEHKHTHTRAPIGTRNQINRSEILWAHNSPLSCGSIFLSPPRDFGDTGKYHRCICGHITDKRGTIFVTKLSAWHTSTQAHKAQAICAFFSCQALYTSKLFQLSLDITGGFVSVCVRVCAFIQFHILSVE